MLLRPVLLFYQWLTRSFIAQICSRILEGLEIKVPECFCRYTGHVNGIADCAVVLATKFASHFESVCKSVKTHKVGLLKPNVMPSEHNTVDL